MHLRKHVIGHAAAVLAAVMCLAPATAGAVQVLPRDPAIAVEGITSGSVTVILDAGNPYNDKPGRPVDHVPVALTRLSAYDLNSPASRADLASKSLQDLLQEAQSEPIYETVLSDAAGKAVFFTVPLGVYAVTSPRADDDFHPLVVIMPTWDATTSTWNANPVVNPKMKGPTPESGIDKPSTTPREPGGNVGTEPNLPGWLTETNKPTPTPASGNVPTSGGATPSATPPAGPNEGTGIVSTLGRLAQTGANVITYALIATLLLILGWVLVAKSRKED